MKRIIFLIFIISLSALSNAYSSTGGYYFQLSASSASIDHEGKKFKGNDFAWGFGGVSNTANVSEKKRFAMGFSAGGQVFTNLTAENIDDKNHFIFIDGALFTGIGILSRVWKGGTLLISLGPAFALSLGHQFCTLGTTNNILLSQEIGGPRMLFGVDVTWLPVSVFSPYNDSSRSSISAYIGLGF